MIKPKRIFDMSNDNYKKQLIISNNTYSDKINSTNEIVIRDEEEDYDLDEDFKNCVSSTPLVKNYQKPIENCNDIIGSLTTLLMDEIANEQSTPDVSNKNQHITVPNNSKDIKIKNESIKLNVRIKKKKKRFILNIIDHLRKKQKMLEKIPKTPKTPKKTKKSKNGKDLSNELNEKSLINPKLVIDHKLLQPDIIYTTNQVY